MSKKQTKESKSIFRSIRDFFSSIQTKERRPDLQRDYTEGGYMDSLTKRTDFAAALGAKPGVSEDLHRLNMEIIEQTRLEQEREATNNSLKAQHRVLIVTVIATFIALFSSVTAIFISLHKDTPPAPVVNVTPAQQSQSASCDH